ncbi:hypothetical protein [Chryseolinea lacunae]|uniref:Uncharacterized protein n=1 Tax=Chryseolinea lacunae TaxID=2801331 RepID=A0ABS1KVZ4_9BACT|nr:hypothetical protein [Chryseolinea lacunae]MBL0743636.1 hypothetical protein [Chryseolinea lacunae]
MIAQLTEQEPVTEAEANPALLDSAIQLAEFVDLETATEARRYDYAMLLALELKNRYSRNRYLATTISKILVDLYDAKNENRMREYVPFYVSGHGDELRMMNTFLHNISKEETGEIAFNFLNNQTNFNPDDPEHYLMLWKICDVTKRETVKARVKERFKTRFGKTKYYFQYFDKMI